MSDDPDAARRRIRWIVALIVFMLALAAIYLVAQRLHQAPKSGVVVNTFEPAS